MDQTFREKDRAPPSLANPPVKPKDKPSHTAWPAALRPPQRPPMLLPSLATASQPLRSVSSSTHRSGWHARHTGSTAPQPCCHRTAANATLALNSTLCFLRIFAICHPWPTAALGARASLSHLSSFWRPPQFAVVAEVSLISLSRVIAAHSDIARQERPAAVYPAASVRLAQSATVLIYRPLSRLACEWLDGPLS